MHWPAVLKFDALMHYETALKPGTTGEMRGLKWQSIANCQVYAVFLVSDIKGFDQICTYFICL